MIVVAVGLPLAALAFARADSGNELPGVTFNAAPVLAAPVPRDIADDKAVKVIPTWAPGVSLLAPAWTGLVTAVSRRVRS